MAFAGSKDNMQLMLEISTQKSKGKNFLYASVDDDVSWQEWDFENLSEFENNIIEYISNRVNRTIKTVAEVSKEIVRVSSYYLDENGQWICFDEQSSSDKFACYIMSRLTKSEETIKTYKLEN